MIILLIIYLIGVVLGMYLIFNTAIEESVDGSLTLSDALILFLAGLTSWIIVWYWLEEEYHIWKRMSDVKIHFKKKK